MSWLAEKLTTLMAERDLPVENVARQLAVERSHMAGILAGNVTPNPPLTRRLAKLFGEDVGEWLDHCQFGGGAAPETMALPKDFVKVAKIADVPEGEMTIVFNDLVAIACVDGAYHAFGNVCPHAAGPIGDGFLDGCIVECPWHSGRWDVRTGKALTLIATGDIPLFDVRTSGDDIEIRLNEAVLTQGTLSSGPDAR